MPIINDPSAVGTKTFRIIAIDGGGIRGIYAAHLLARISEEFTINIAEKCDLIAGTSTGAILASGVAVGIPPSALRELYENNGVDIFGSRSLSFWGVLSSVYKKDALRQILLKTFGNRTLGDITPRLLLPATDIGNGVVHVFKSPYSEEFVRDRSVKLVDAILASCSAPIYFDPERVNEYLLADGGLWANNPGLVAAVETLGRLQVPKDKIRLLSIGCGTSRAYYQTSSTTNKWGLLTGWKGKKLIDLVLNLQSDTGSNMLSLLLQPHQYLRITFDTDRALPLDAYDGLQELRSKADHDFTHHAGALRTFFGIQ